MKNTKVRSKYCSLPSYYFGVSGQMSKSALNILGTFTMEAGLNAPSLPTLVSLTPPPLSGSQS